MKRILQVITIIIILSLVSSCATPVISEKPKVEKAYLTKSVDLPVLMYHHISYGEGKTSVTPEIFEMHIVELKTAGYNTIDIFDLYEYVTGDTELPENPILITFDDGYTSNIEYGYPILKKYDYKATVFVIGSMMGKDTYHDGLPMIPHFSTWDVDSVQGVLDVQSHGYGFHAVDGRYSAGERRGVLRHEGESHEDYVKAFENDCDKMSKLLGYTPVAFAYPYGEYNEESHQILKDLGFVATVTIDEGINTIVRGDPDSLYNLKRFNMTNETTPQELIQTIKNEKTA